MPGRTRDQVGSPRTEKSRPVASGRRTQGVRRLPKADGISVSGVMIQKILIKHGLGTRCRRPAWEPRHSERVIRRTQKRPLRNHDSTRAQKRPERRLRVRADYRRTQENGAHVPSITAASELRYHCAAGYIISFSCSTEPRAGIPRPFMSGDRFLPGVGCFRARPCCKRQTLRLEEAEKQRKWPRLRPAAEICTVAYGFIPRRGPNRNHRRISGRSDHARLQPHHPFISQHRLDHGR